MAFLHAAAAAAFASVEWRCSELLCQVLLCVLQHSPWGTVCLRNKAVAFNLQLEHHVLLLLQPLALVSY